MHAFLHIIGTVVVVPYVALALLFVFIGQLARSKGLWALVDAFWNNLDWYVSGGFHVAVAIWVCLVVTGCIPTLQRGSSLGLSILAAASFIVIVCLSSSRLGIGEIVFLFPCVAVAVTGAWLCFRGVAN